MTHIIPDSTCKNANNWIPSRNEISVYSSIKLAANVDSPLNVVINKKSVLNNLPRHSSSLRSCNKTVERTQFIALAACPHTTITAIHGDHSRNPIITYANPHTLTREPKRKGQIFRFLNRFPFFKWLKRFTLEGVIVIQGACPCFR